MGLEIWDDDGVQYGQGWGDKKIAEYWNKIIAGEITGFKGDIKLVNIISILEGR